MSEALHERVAVVVTFDASRAGCSPRKFRRSNGREVDISEVGLYHAAKRGAKVVHIFDVSDGESDYRLEFDSQRLVWHITGEVSADEY